MGLAELTYSTPCVGKVKRDFSLQPYCRFAYSALASFRMGISGSASFQRGIFAVQERPDKGGVGIRPLRGLRLQGSGTNYFQTRQVCDEGLQSRSLG